MAPTISQISAASYDAVLTDSRKASNQWADSALLNKFESMGFVDKKSFGDTLEETLDYRINPDADFLASELQLMGMSATEVLTAASFSIAELSVPVKWSKRTEVQNPTENQKVSVTKSLLTNGFDSHDYLVEQKMFATSAYNGFNTFNTLISTAGTGTVGGIDSGLETWWRNQAGTYLADGSDMEAQFTTIYNNISKGSGSPFAPKLMWSGSTPHAIFEATQTPQQRYNDTQDLKIGAKTLAFKTAGYVFSQFGGSKVYFGGPKVINLKVSKEYYRDKSETQEFDMANGFSFKIYSALQLTVSRRNRLGVCETA